MVIFMSGKVDFRKKKSIISKRTLNNKKKITPPERHDPKCRCNVPSKRTTMYETDESTIIVGDFNMLLQQLTQLLNIT